ncbi:hypothetical protein DPSP01_002210 [Paraphaeosphaeria sporulosa]|uniref:Rhodopsin domain-containing protein n=1 Tax=Paraphaeosphaeria sporulosa TaxID=1460663 RepID=A0A177C1I5_9PLEO|nr:uncharacterized protein CC84DRAFT_1155601 [Paraphaeosphaeria sporulosa]OAG00658.1 hypothetical protein CC84DRAFT_1155601 [Paraphaeosphaeria sporulosa]
MNEDGTWPNRGGQILGATLSICILSTGILIWRIVYGIQSKRKLMICDYLLIVAACLNVASSGIRIKSTIHGQGRHINDPSISKPHDILQYSYYLYIGQIINLIAVAILKLSICTYLLALPFGLTYKLVIYLSIAMVAVFNFTLPMMGQLCAKPFEANWNKSIKGTRFYKGSTALTYMQGVSNILTDVVYIVAPILYLSSVQLSSKTQWGLRLVFCLGLTATVCSIFKTVELKSLLKTRDPTWDGVNLTIWSATELSVGILVASLPPLRKQFERILRKVLPSTLQTSNKRTPGSHSGIPMYNVSKVTTKRNTRIMGRSDVGIDDGDSERSILPDGGSDTKVDRGIMKTVVHEVTSESRSETGKEVPQSFEQRR